MHGILLNVKRTTILLLAGVLALALSACGGAEVPTPQTQVQGATATPAAVGGSGSSTSSGGASQQSGVAPSATSAAAASEDQSDGVDLSRVDACTILTKQELEAAVGPLDDTPEPIDASDEGWTKSCMFSSPLDSASNSLAKVTLGPPKRWDAEYQGASEGGKNPQAVAGVGDDAFVEEVRTLVVRVRGKATVKLTLVKGDTPFDPEQAKQLILKVFDRLP